jgi:hypothetical protein
MNPADKDAPKGALEEAVSLFDDLLMLVEQTGDRGKAHSEEHYHQLNLFRRRRAALEPRLAKRRDNQAKSRGDKP